MKSDQIVAVLALILVIVIAINQINSVDSNYSLCYYVTTLPHPKDGWVADVVYCITSRFEESNLFFQNGW